MNFSRSYSREALISRVGNGTEWLRAPQYSDLVQVVENSRLLHFMEGTLAASLMLGTCLACGIMCAASCVGKFHISVRAIVILTVIAISCFALVDAGAESLLMDTKDISVTLQEINN